MHGHNRKMPNKKEKADFSAIKKLVIYCKSYFALIVVAIICAVVSAITTILGPDKIQDLMNEIVNGINPTTSMDMDFILKICIFLLSLYIIGAFMSYSQQFIMATVTQKTSKKLRNDINMKLDKLPLSYFDKTTKGDILSRVTNDVDTISQTLGSSVANLVNSLVLFIGVIIMMFKSNWILALTTIACSLLGFFLMGLILGKSQKYFNLKQQHLGQLNGQIEEVYSNHTIVKSFNAENNEIKKFNKINAELYNDNWKSQFLSGMMQPIMNFVGNFCYVAIFVVGVALIINDFKAMTFGAIIAFTIYARLFSNPLTTFAQSMTSIQQASAASERVFEILELEEMQDESNKINFIENVKGDIEFKDIHFRYVPEKPIINGFSANIKSGQKVAIVGPTGAGKTTIVNLLMRFYDVDSGDITIDGISTKAIKREAVHDLFDMILQDTWLFKGTVRENLVFNKTNVKDDKVLEICRAVGLGHFIETLPYGLDTILDENANLSEGQKQQLTIARAMIKDAPLLILDEATSNVDTRTELVIQEAMDKLTKGRTSFVIAHRLSTIKNADIILVLKNGDIVESGTHNELLAQNGFYADLYNSQFEV
ncbi:MAG: ABC transporter ATP-binding protein/permease [Anaeroplasma sp.]|nr:ABC transporter ATP-binding protein/permease [Anaeroplasma sp.]